MHTKTKKSASKKIGLKHTGDPKQLLKKMLKPTAGALCATALLLTPLPDVQAAASAAPAVTAISQTAESPAILKGAWAPEARTALQDFLKLYGRTSPGYDRQIRPYAVFDFDNTTSIMDVEEQLMIWQLDHLAFAIPPNEMRQILCSGMPEDKRSLTYGADDGSGRPVSINDAIDDAVRAYTALCAKGLVSRQGHEPSAALQTDADYNEFRAKMRWLYDAISETMDSSVSYPWVTYWFTHMTPDEVYHLAYTCDSWYGAAGKGQTWSKGTYTSPAVPDSKTGSISVSYKLGITVTPEVKDLYHQLHKNGFDVWIDSASPLDVVRAAVDYFQIPDVKGIVAMTNQKDASGRYINAYDYDQHAQTQGIGKSLTISKVIAPQYQGHGPAFCAMDSQGDFNFCTEFRDTKAVLIMNRKRSDDAALCAGIAEYQKQHHVTVAEANAAGDTRFILQGRDENTGKLWADDHTQLLGKKDKAFLSDKAQKAIAGLESGQTIRQVLQENTQRKDYPGYKTR